MKKSRKDIVKCIRFDYETITKLEEIAEEKERNISDLIRIILRNYIKQNEDI